MRAGNESTTVRSRPVAGLIRRIIGYTGLAMVVVAAILYLLALWNPWQLVALKYTWFGNPMLGLLVVPLSALVAVWLALPVQNEARQRGRIVVRASCGALVIVGVFAWGIFGDHFAFDGEEAARTSDGELAAALVRDRDTPPRTYVRVWSGSGLATQEVGDVGRVCGSVEVRFPNNTQLEVRTAYGTWRIDLDPATGEPLQVFAGRCVDAPVPLGAPMVPGGAPTG